MKLILNKIGKSPPLFPAYLPPLDSQLHLLFAKDMSILGLGWDSTILILLFKTFSSFRIHLPNLGEFGGGISIVRALYEVDTNYLDLYFQENRDNPYAIWNVFHRVRREEPIEDLTQFPPLEGLKDPQLQQTRASSLAARAQPGDIVFSSDRTSPVSSLIRKYDRCPWSHVAPVTTRLTTVDVGPGATTENPLERFMDTRYDVALYRHREISLEDGVVIGRHSESRIGPSWYNWYAIFRYYLRSRFKIPYTAGPTIADIIYSNSLDLIAYA